MLFNSISFLIFFPIVLLVYFVIPRKCRYIWLLLASYYFYMSWNIGYTALLFASTLITYGAALLLEKNAKRQGAKKLISILSIALNLSILVVFKYLGFLLDSVFEIGKLLGFSGTAPVVDLLLPVGISFYIFQAVGYMVDVYRGSIQAERNFALYALFVSFFPQLVAGPIERSTTLLPQLKQMKDLELWDASRIQKGALTMLYGYFLKMILADRIAVYVDTVFHPTEYGNYQGIVVFLAAILFSIQIYCDFAGYTYIAIGAARVMGFTLMNNFNMPYLAMDIKDFWDRWHISLSGWFRDYVYFPLGGSRKGTTRKYVNIMIVFAVSGLWHGAAWHFVVWGLLHGVGRVLGEPIAKLRIKIYASLHYQGGTTSEKVRRIVVTFLLVTGAWVFFRAGSVDQAVRMFGQMFAGYNPWVLTDGTLFTLGLDAKEWNVMLTGLAIMLLVDCLRYKGADLVEKFVQQNCWFRWIFFYVGIMAVIIFGVYGAQYQAANFIYFQF